MIGSFTLGVEVKVKLVDDMPCNMKGRSLKSDASGGSRLM